MDLVYQSGAYDVLVNKGKWHLFQGNREGLAYHLGDRIPPKSWHTILLEIRHCNTSNDVQTDASA